jgi:hypothetical protein
MKKFVVIRIANKADGTVSVPANAFETQAEADNQYLTYRQQANASNNPSDTVIMMTNTGFILEQHTYEHEVEAAE